MLNWRLRFVLVGAIAAAPATWWISGGNTAPTFADPEYLVKPLPLSPVVQAAIGVVALLLTSVGAAVGIWQIAHRRWPLRWSGIVGPLYLVSAYAGYVYYGLVNPVLGGNIDAGLIIFFGIPWLLLLLGVMVWSAWPRKPTLPPTPCDDPPVFGRW